MARLSRALPPAMAQAPGDQPSSRTTLSAHHLGDPGGHTEDRLHRHTPQVLLTPRQLQLCGRVPGRAGLACCWEHSFQCDQHKQKAQPQAASQRPPAPVLRAPGLCRPDHTAASLVPSLRAFALTGPHTTSSFGPNACSPAGPTSHQSRGTLSASNSHPTAASPQLISGQFRCVPGICELALSHWGPSVPSTGPQ